MEDSLEPMIAWSSPTDSQSRRQRFTANPRMRVLHHEGADLTVDGCSYRVDRHRYELWKSDEAHPKRTVSIEMEPPSTPSTGKVMSSSLVHPAITYSSGR